MIASTGTAASAVPDLIFGAVFVVLMVVFFEPEDRK